VELLVVISIIGLLAGLTSVAVSRAMDSGKNAKAKSEAMALVSAVKAYKQEYGRFPGNLSQSNAVEFTDDSFKDLVKVLIGDSTNTLSGSQPANPKGVRFLEGAKGGTNGMPDPWNHQYIVIVDTGETGGIVYTNAETPVNLSLSVLAISYGKDGVKDTKSGTKNDIFSTDLK
jgi:type II secretory pathway pseudopilin PulG